jgi:hypothetical protein
MVRSVIVMVTVALDGSVEVDCIVMTKLVVELDATLPEALPLNWVEIIAEVVDLTKKSTGYVSVMLLPVASAPLAEVVNENVAAADVLPATRS